MNDSITSLPPQLAEALAELQQRYRRHRFLRAALSTLLYSAIPSVIALALWRLDVPVTPLMLLTGWLVVLSVLVLIFFCPLWRRPLTLRDVAHQVDRCHPELKDRLLSAVAFQENPDEREGSAWMVSSFFADTEVQLAASPLDRVVQPNEVRRVAWMLGLCASVYLVAASAFWLEGVVRHRDETLSRTTLSRLAALEVEPGDTTAMPGDEVMVWVTSDDTDGARRIYWEGGGASGSALLQTSSTPRVGHHTFDNLTDSFSYWVTVGKQTSPRYEVTVQTPPALESIQLTYDYPDYLGEPDRVVPFGGDITGVEGTKVTIAARSNKPVASAALVYATGKGLALEASEDELLWSTTLILSESGQYHVVLQDEAGVENSYPDEYRIEVQADGPPEIQVRLPRGDSEVLALEEVDFAFSVKDDFGVSDYGIEYTIAGREAVRVPLHADGPSMREIVGEHLLALEETGVAVGDLITWAVWADDRKPGRLPYEIMSDPYFLEVRPYTRRFREQVSQGGEGQPGSSNEQRQVIIAIWNLRKAAPDLTQEAFEEQAGAIQTAQQELREQLLAMPGGDAAQALIVQEAATAMEAVETQLAAADWSEPEEAFSKAMEQAQLAFHHVLRLEPEERQIARTEGGQGGGGSTSKEIESLEMSKRKDYQEEARTGEASVEEQESLRNRLEELARRQEVLNEDMAKTLAEEEALSEAEKKRRLERLEKEQQRQLDALDEVANDVAASRLESAQRDSARQQLEEARKGMESSLESVRQEALQQARTAGERAEDALDATEDTVAQLTREGARARFDELQEEMAELREAHEGLEGERDALREGQTTPGITDAEVANTQLEQYQRDKVDLAEATRDLLEEAGTLSDQVRKDQNYVSRKLGDWVRKTERTGVVEEMVESPRFAEMGMWDALGMKDAQIGEKLAEAEAGLEALAGEWSSEPGDAMSRALERLAALEEGLSDRAAAGQEDNEALEGAGTPSPTSEPDAEAGPGEEAGDGGPGTESDATSENAAGQNPSPEGTPVGDPSGTPSDRAAGEPGSPSESPGQPGQDSGAAPGESPGQVGRQPGGSPVGEATGGGSGGDPQGSPGGRGVSGGDVRRFLEGGDWRGELADAIALLPRDSEARPALEQMGMDLGRFQREYDNNQQLPDVTEFQQVVQRPLRSAIESLEREIVRTGDEDSRLEDEGAIPEQYVDRVAEYFRLLAEGVEVP